METLYHQTNKLIQQTQDSFRVLETSPGNAIQVEYDIQEKIDVIDKNCERLEIQVNKSPANQRAQARLLLEQLRYDARHLRAGLAAARGRRERQARAREEREQLLLGGRQNGAHSDSTAIDMGLQHREQLSGAGRGVDELITTGAATLESLRSQRLVLKGAQRRLVDMANTLGLSGHTVRLIERRVSQDWYVLVGGMAVTVLVIVLVVIYLL